jgi:hypothetical protein
MQHDAGIERLGRQLRMPSFIGVGPVRTGTTWLDSIFRGHLALPQGIKEPQFFGWRYRRGIEWYARFFRDSPSGRVVGEFGPTYFFEAKARERIARHIPRCKIVCTLRDPVERVYSHYKLWRKLAILKHSFNYEIEHNPALSMRLTYSAQVREWQRIFGVDNTLVLIYEDSRADRQGYIDAICSFIDAPRLDLARNPNEVLPLAHFERAPRFRNLARRMRQFKDLLEENRCLKLRNLLDPVLEWCMAGGEPFPPLDPELELKLRRRVAPDIAELEEILGRDLSIWRKPVAKEQLAVAS